MSEELPRLSNVDSGAVQNFVRGMREKLRQNAHKAHWRKADYGYLIGRIGDECKELVDALFGENPDPAAAIQECYDIANFAMMVADNLQKDMDHG